jgi:hypothetical protein
VIVKVGDRFERDGVSGKIVALVDADQEEFDQIDGDDVRALVVQTEYGYAIVGLRAGLRDLGVLPCQ